ncbi:MAG TPA: hypothetical protein VD993_04525 [Chitinophagaceae bacterium]|nr:hypothetical protein [Chitinophagaceae bacterium]
MAQAPIFPEISTSEPFPNDMPEYRMTSEFAESPFQTSAGETQECFFGSADTYTVNGVEIIAENNVSPTIIDEISSYQQSNVSLLYDMGESPVSPYAVKVFVSKDNSYLQQAFEKTEPLPHEVCLFLEDNSTDIFSDGAAYAKVGEQFRDDLAMRRQIAETEGGNITQFTFLNDNNEDDLNINFTEEQLKELIETGEITNLTRQAFISIFQVVNFGTLILTPIYQLLGDGIIWMTEGIRYYIKFQDYHWDPAAEQPEGGAFEPILCPFANELMAAEGFIGEAVADTIADGLVAAFREWKAEFESNWALYSTISGAYPVPAHITDFLARAEENILYLADKIEMSVNTMVKVFIYIGENCINAFNAFYCGLWNSLVEAVLGIVDLVGYIFKGLAMAGDAVNNAQTLVPQALEMLDELWQALMRTELIDVINAAIDAVLKQLSNINIMTMVNAISVERTAYFLGGFIGFIVEIAAGMVYSGGLASINTVVQKIANFGKIGSEVLTFIQSAVGRTFGAASAFSLEYIMAIARKIIELLRMGKDEVVKFIDDVFEVMRRAAQLTDEVIDEIMKKFDITPTDKQLIDELGLVFTNYAEETCSICNKTIG